MQQNKRLRPQSLDKQQKQEDVSAKQAKNIKKLFAYKGNFTAKDIKYQNKLGKKFFRQEVVELSKQLLGKLLVRQTPDGIIKAVIVETQAYKAPLDKACHAYNNKKTEKTKYFWLDGGSLYIYTIYMPTNICLNVVAGVQGQPEAVLIRAVQPIVGVQIIQKHRKIQSKKLEDLCNGPGKVGLSLLVDKQKMNGIDLLDGQLRVIDAGINDFQMQTSRRVNIDYAEQWIDKPWRFYVKNNTYVSKVNFDAPKKQKSKSKKKQQK